MFSRAKPLGLTDDLFNLLAHQLETIDGSLENALDGAGGGTVAPTTPLIINGAGLASDALKDTTIAGSLQRVGTGRWKQKVDTTSITDTASTQLLDMSNDVYRTSIDHTANITIHLAVTTGETPSAGDVIQVTREGIPSSPASFQIYSEYATGTRIGAFIQAAPAGYQENEIYSAQYFFNGTTWRPLRFSSDVLY